MLYTTIPKIITFFAIRRIFWPYLYKHMQKLNTWWIIWQVTLLLIPMKFFGSQIFPFLQKWHHTYLQRAYTEAEVSLHIGYYLGFLPHLEQERTSPHPTQSIMTLFITFEPANQNILAWATLHSLVLHHCISSMLYCKPNTHFVQDPNNDYTHAYKPTLSNLLSCQLPFWSLSVFWLLNFLVFIFAQLPLVNRQHIVWTFPKKWLLSQSTLQKT